MAKTALITGITGQDGSYLAEALLGKGYVVIGLVRRTTTIDFERIAHIQDEVRLVTGDLLDQGSLVEALTASAPDEVYNLAAHSVVQTSFAQPVLTADATALGVTRLLEAIRMVDSSIRFFQASTSEMFGRAVTEPQDEQTPFHPRSPYGVAKVYGHWITVNYREEHGLHASSGIMFNHESPRRGNEFVTRKITRAVARIEAGLETELRLGNLDARRDWGFAGDYVDAMWRMLQCEDPGDFVICTGRTRSVRDFCEVAFSCADLDYADHVVIDDALVRPQETSQLVGDPAKARRDLDWVATTPFEDLVAMMVEADRRQVRQQHAAGGP